MKTKAKYTIGWILWLAAFVALEGSALFNRTAGDTLSEHTWSWFHVFDPHAGPVYGVLRVLLFAFLAWLAFHMTFGWFTPSRPLPRLDSLMTSSALPPTQTRHPWRATLRTVVAAGVSLLSLLPVIATTAHVDTVPAVAQVLVVTGAVTRVLAIPAVDGWLRKYAPFLAASK